MAQTYVRIPSELAMMAVRACDDAAYRFEREAGEAGDEATARDRQRRRDEYKEAQAALERALWGQEAQE